MKIRRLRKRKEVREYSDGRLIIRCPICGIPWITEYEGDVEHNTCRHVRFFWYGGAASTSPTYYGDWDTESFETAALNFLNSQEGEGDELYDELPGFASAGYLRQLLSSVETSEVDEVWEYSFLEEYCMGGGGNASIFWGIKKESQVEDA